jgi:multicomponent Na+:H+ antiporter subunit D
MIFSWDVALVVLPLAVSVVIFVVPRSGRAVGLMTAIAQPLLVIGLIREVVENGPWRQPLGGWGVPLGIELQIDGLSVLMVAMTALVGSLTTIYGLSYFREQGTDGGGVIREMFWPLWFLLWGSMNVLFFSADAFNLYIALELVTLAGVALIGLAGTAVALTAAMRYLLAALFGSLCYLLGVALLYGKTGVLDLHLLAGAASGGGPVIWTALALMTTGLLLKTALFPLHFWLPPAHASAPAPVSAVLSGLVVKASFYLVLRFWFEVFPAAGAVSHLLGLLGVAAILWGSLQALREKSLKLLVAYSTVAQLGYLFLLFPLAPAGGFDAWGGGVHFALSHACAKAAMFLAAGTILHAAGHDRIAEFGSLGPSLKGSLIIFAVAGWNLIGLPPSGGYTAKKMLVEAAHAGGEWWLVIAIYAGSLLTAAYLFRVLLAAFRPHAPAPLRHAPAGMLQWTALLLAVAALFFGPFSEYPLGLLAIGAPFAISDPRLP